MSVEYCIISIGTLSHNRLWGEAAAVRPSHATTTVVYDDDRTILVDPSLPGPALAARFAERTGKNLSDVTDVFCTTLRPVHRRGLAALDGARWWCSEQELQWYQEQISQMLEASREHLGEEDVAAARADLKLLERFTPAEDASFGKGVQVYPLAGPTPGTTGLLLTPPTSTILIASDAAVTAEHVMRGQVWKGCCDTQTAMDSLRDLLELADIIIPGHDNIMLMRQQWI